MLSRKGTHQPRILPGTVPMYDSNACSTAPLLWLASQCADVPARAALEH